MSLRVVQKTLTGLLGFFLIAILACSGNASQWESPTQPTKNASSQAKSVPKKPKVTLAKTPRMDLLSNRFLWHLYREGLYIPVAGDGFYKYTQEYNNPWGDVIENEGHSGRILRKRGATLRIPWEKEEDTTLLLRVKGVADKQRMTLYFNEKKSTNLDLERGWQIAKIPVAKAWLKPGENTIRLSVSKQGSVSGTSTYGLYHSLELVPASVTIDETWPPLTPVEEDSLTNFSQTKILVEVVPTSWLDFSTVGEGEFRIDVTTVKNETQTIFTHKESGESQHTVSLKDYENQLVRLSFSKQGNNTVWKTPFLGIEEKESMPRPPAAQNGIVFVVDALRSDKLEVYNPETPIKTPRLTKAVNEYGIVMLHNQAASPSSPPSHGSLQTGMIPRVHGVVGDEAELIPGTPMMSTMLGKAGIATAYYGNNPFGMARLEKPGKWTEFHQTLKEGKGIDCDPLVKDMLDFASRQNKAGKRFFISALPYETHTPYRYHEGITNKFYDGAWDPKVGKSVDGVLLSKLSTGKETLTENQWKQLKALYDGEVERMDICFGQLLDGLSALGVLEDTAIILTSDHGEGMFEHGKMGHAFGHFAELANVPFIILYPKLQGNGRLIETVSSHIDIAPTIVDLMGIPIAKEVQGISVLPIVLRQGPWVPRVVSLEYGRSFALRATNWKYIVEYDQSEKVFFSQTDPNEQNEVKETYPMALRYFRDNTGFFLRFRSLWDMETWGSFNNHQQGFLEK